MSLKSSKCSAKSGQAAGQGLKLGDLKTSRWWKLLVCHRAPGGHEALLCVCSCPGELAAGTAADVCRCAAGQSAAVRPVTSEPRPRPHRELGESRAGQKSDARLCSGPVPAQRTGLAQLGRMRGGTAGSVMGSCKERGTLCSSAGVPGVPTGHVPAPHGDGKAGSPCAKVAACGWIRPWLSWEGVPSVGIPPPCHHRTGKHSAARRAWLLSLISPPCAESSFCLFLK